MNSRLRLGIFFLLNLSFCSTLYAQENFNIRQRMNLQMIRKYSVEVASMFEQKIVQFNKNHQKIEYFLNEYQEDKDRRFLEQYFARHEVNSFRPFHIHEGRAIALYGGVRVEIGPVEALENKVLLDGKSYQLNSQQGLRARIVEIEQLVENHLQQNKTTGQKIRNIFSSLQFFPSLISTANANQNLGPTKERFYTQSIVAALIVTGDKIHLKSDVRRDWTGKNKDENIHAMLKKFESSNRQCQEELISLRGTHEHDRSQHESYIPVASIQDYSFAGELNARVEELENRDIDPANFVRMTDLLENHFAERFSAHLDRNVCWGLFARSFARGKEDPTIDRACNSFDELHECLVEMRHIDRISEVQRANVSKKFFDNRIPPRDNAFRNGRPASAQIR